jgi:amidase
MTSFTQERAGPMARTVYDVAALTDVVTGFDAEDLLTIASPGNTPAASYTTFLDKNGLRGARIGVFRDLFRKGEAHAEGVALVEKAIAQMKEAGAIIVDPVSTGIDLFMLLEDTRTNYYEAQFSYNLYFRRLGQNAPIRNMDELLAKGGALVKPSIVKGYREFNSLMHHPDFLARRDTQETLRLAVIELMDKYRLDALVHPFKSVPPPKHQERSPEQDNPLSSVTGLPALLVPAGYTQATNGPIAIEFLGRPFSEPTLFRLGYAYEQVSKVRKLPPATPSLPGERFEY